MLAVLQHKVTKLLAASSSSASSPAARVGGSGGEAGGAAGGGGAAAAEGIILPRMDLAALEACRSDVYCGVVALLQLLREHHTAQPTPPSPHRPASPDNP